MNRDSIDFGTGEVAALFRKIFIPTLLGMLSISAVTVIDGIFVGHGVGSDGIAAINIFIPVLMLFTGLGMMAGAGCSVVASIHLSRGQIRAARFNVSQSLTFVTVVSAVFTLLIMSFPQSCARLLGASDNLMPQVVDYMMWFMPAMVFEMWISVGLFVVRLDGAPRMAMWCSVVSALSNVLFDWVLIFPLGLGVKGAAMASSLSILLGGVMVAYYLFFRARQLKPLAPKRSIKSLRLSLRNIGYQCRIGFSGLVGEATMAMLMFAGNRVFMHWLGDDGVGAFGIACYYAPFIFMVGNAIAQSAQPIISFNFGAGNMLRVGRAVRVAVVTALLCGAVVSAAFVAAPRILVGLFLDTSDPAARIAIEGFPLFATGFVCFVLNLTLIGCYQSLERVLPSTLFAALRGVVFLVPSFVWLPCLLGTRGIWLAMPLSEALTLAAIIIFMLTERKRGTAGM